jgi:autotransporter-associated beta strand protein
VIALPSGITGGFGGDACIGTSPRAPSAIGMKMLLFGRLVGAGGAVVGYGAHKTTPMKKTILLPFVLLLAGMIAHLPPTARAGTLSVTNGSFTDLTGLSGPSFGVWYGGVPAGWSTLAASNTFAVLNSSGTYYANLDTLSTISPFQPLRQTVGTVDVTSDITLSFTLTTLSGSPTADSAIYNLATDGALAVFTSATIAGVTNVTYTARGVAPGTGIYIGFWDPSGPGGPAPGLTGVSVVDSSTTYTWNGGVSGVWTNGGGGWLDNFDNTATNYSNARPVVAQFTNAAAGTNVTVASDGVTVGAVEVSGANHTISGGSITMTNTTWTVASSRTAIVGSTLAGTTGLAKSGSGVLVLSGSNSYSGTTTISNGTLLIGNSGTTGSYSGDTVVASGGTLAFSRTDAYTHGGAISGAGAVTKVDAGAVTLTASNSYSGVTTLFAGTLVADNANALGSGDITFRPEGGNTGTIRYTAASAGTDWASRIKNSTGTIRLNTDGNNVTLAGAMDGSNTEGFVKSGAGTLTLSGNNAYTGATIVDGGVLQLNRTGGQSLGTTASVSVSSGATLLISQSGQVNDSATVTLSGGTIQRGSGVNEVFGDINITSASFLDFGSGATGTIQFQAYANAGSSTVAVNNFAEGNKLQFHTNSFTGVNLAQFTFSNGYTTGIEGSYFTITAIPEPSTLLAVAGLLGVLLWPASLRILRVAGAHRSARR